LHKIGVIGCGNPLLCDEGIGIHCLEALKKENLPFNIELLEVGTSIDLLNLKGFSKIVIIDCLKGKGKPGSIYCLKEEEIELEGFYPLSLHEFSLFDSLSILKKEGSLPNSITIIGIEPERIDWGLEPTDTLKEKIPEVIKLVLEECMK